MPEAIAVIIVNYNTAALSIEAVESVLRRKNAGYDVTIYLVDNASPLGDAEILQRAHEKSDWGEKVQLVIETENHGFGRGNNVVLHALENAEVSPNKVFLLNPDARLENEAIAILANTLEDNPTAAAVGASVLGSDLSPVSSAFRFPTPLSEISRLLRLGIVDKFLQSRLVPLPPHHPAGIVDWVSGACVMFRFEAIAQIGFFDPRYFLYYEEVDLMRRVTERGWHVLYQPLARVVHEEGAATGQYGGASARKSDPSYLYESWAHYFEGAYGRPRATLIALMQWPVAIGNILHRRLRFREPTIPIGFFRDHWRYVLRPLLWNGR